VECVPLRGDGAERLDPELKAGGREMGPKLPPNAFPDRGEIVWEGFWGHGGRS
jgi:hypothetical protein